VNTLISLAAEGSSGVTGWLDRNGHVFAAPLRILLIIVLALTLRMVVQRLISRVTTRMITSTVHERLAERKAGRIVLDSGLLPANERRQQRAETVGAVLRSTASLIIFSVAFVMVLDELGLQLGPILASAGIAGVALGFGAQNLVKDFLAGIFIIFEDQYGVGDVIDTGEASGTVEDVGLRITRLRDVGGVVWYVRNGEILRVGNKSQGWSRAIVDVPVAYSEKISEVQDLIQQTANALAADSQFDDAIVEPPVVAGVESIGNGAVVIRVMIKTAPLKHVDVARELRARLMTVFDEAGVQVSPIIRPAAPGAGGPNV